MTTAWILGIELVLLVALSAAWLALGGWRRKRHREAALETLIARLETTLPERLDGHREWLQTRLHLSGDAAGAVADRWLEAEKRFWRRLVDAVLEDGPTALGQLSEPLHRYLDDCLEGLEAHLAPTDPAVESDATDTPETETPPAQDTTEPPADDTGTSEPQPPAAEDGEAEAVELFSDDSTTPEAEDDETPETDSRPEDDAAVEVDPPQTDGADGETADGGESPATAAEPEEETAEDEGVEVFSDSEPQADQSEPASR